MFGKVLEMSIVGSYCILLALLLRLLLLRCERKYAYYLWLAVFLSLALPIAPQGEYSLIPKQVTRISVVKEREAGEKRGMGTVGQSKTGGEPQVGITGGTEADKTAGEKAQSAAQAISAQDDQMKAVQSERSAVGRMAPVTEESAQEERLVTDVRMWMILSQIIRIIWIVGLSLLILFNMFHTFRLKKMISPKRWVSWDAKSRIAEVSGLATPFLWGVWRPVIYLPTGLDAEEKKYIIAHESCHRKRKDSVLKIAVFAVTAVHWFNPLVWVAWILFCRDMEVSCDEAVLAGAGVSVKKEYAQSLLKYAAAQSGYMMTPVTFGEPSVKMRIKNVLRFRKKNVVLTVAAAFIVAAAAFGIIVHPQEIQVQPELVTLGLSEDLTGERRQYYVENGEGTAEAGIYSRVGEEKKGELLLAGNFEALWEDETRLYVSRREAEGLFIDCVRKANGYVESNLTGRVIETELETAEPKIFSFFANENYIVFAAGYTEGSLGITYSTFYSYNRRNGELLEKHVTFSTGFEGVIKDNIYYQKYEFGYEEGEEGNELYRMDLAFYNEMQVGENLSFLLWDEENDSLLAAKSVDETNEAQLVRVDFDGGNERTLFDTASLNWDNEVYDKFLFRDIKLQGDGILFTVEQWGYRGKDGFRDSLIRYAQILMKSDGSGYEKVSEEIIINAQETAGDTENEDAAPNSRKQAYILALKELCETGILPDGDDWNTFEPGYEFVIYDIDSDGEDELIFWTSGMATVANGYLVYDYEEETGDIVRKLEGRT